MLYLLRELKPQVKLLLLIICLDSSGLQNASEEIKKVFLINKDIELITLMPNVTENKF